MRFLRSIIGIICLNIPAHLHAQPQTLKATLHHTFQAHSAPPRQLAFSPDSKILATSGVDSVVKLLSKSNPAVLVQEHGVVQGIVTRSDMLHFMMSR